MKIEIFQFFQTCEKLKATELLRGGYDSFTYIVRRTPTGFRLSQHDHDEKLLSAFNFRDTNELLGKIRQFSAINAVGRWQEMMDVLRPMNKSFQLA